MSDNDLHDVDGTELLLPWYVSGRLDEAERAQVERWLEAHPEARVQLALIEEESGLAIADNERLPVPGPGALDRLMAQVASESRSRISLLARVGEWLGSLSPQMRGGLVAACLALFAVQGATIGGLMREGGEARFTTASGETQARGPGLLVTFAPDASMEAVVALLEEVNGRIIDGPAAGGIYRISLPAGADASAAADLLKARGNVVTFVAPGS